MRPHGWLAFVLLAAATGCAASAIALDLRTAANVAPPAAADVQGSAAAEERALRSALLRAQEADRRALALGVVAAFASLAIAAGLARTRRPGASAAAPRWMAACVALTSTALLADAALAFRRLPGRPWDDRDPRWDVEIANDLLARDEARGCAFFEDAFFGDRGAKARALAIAGMQAAADRCVIRALAAGDLRAIAQSVALRHVSPGVALRVVARVASSTEGDDGWRNGCRDVAEVVRFAHEALCERRDCDWSSMRAQAASCVARGFRPISACSHGDAFQRYAADLDRYCAAPPSLPESGLFTLCID